VATGLINGTIDAGTAGTYTVSVIVSDDATISLSDTADFVWNVYPVNNAPVLTYPGYQVNMETDTIALQIIATDPDTSNTLIYTASNLPPNLSIDSTTGLISGVVQIGAGMTGIHTVEVIVRDDGFPQLTDTTEFDWDIDAEVIRIMPLGASSTEGNPTPNGYRPTLKIC